MFTGPIASLTGKVKKMDNDFTHRMGRNGLTNLNHYYQRYECDRTIFSDTDIKKIFSAIGKILIHPIEGRLPKNKEERIAWYREYYAIAELLDQLGIEYTLEHHADRLERENLDRQIIEMLGNDPIYKINLRIN